MGEDADHRSSAAARAADAPVGLDALIAPGAVLEKVAGGCTWNEGPAWVRPPGLGHGVLRWSDIPGDRIMQLDPVDGSVTVHRTGVEHTNGRTPAPDGGVYQCSHGLRRLEHEVDGPDGPVVTAVAERWGDARLNSPNDVVCAADGSVWFSDPPYGIVMEGEGHPGEREYGGSFVFRLDPAEGSAVGGGHRPAWPPTAWRSPPTRACSTSRTRPPRCPGAGTGTTSGPTTSCAGPTAG